MKVEGLLLNRVLIVVAFSFLVSCENKEKELELIESAIELKKEIYKQELKAECHVELLLEVDQQVDSLILLKSKVRSGVEKPEKPERPIRPEVNFVDTIQMPSTLHKDSIKL